MQPTGFAGQLNAAERSLLSRAVLDAAVKPQVILEVGTWLGGGSTLCFLHALEQNGEGHLWGVEANPSIYDQMLQNISNAVPEALPRFTPLFGFSEKVIPKWLNEIDSHAEVDLVFLDGGDSPLEQIIEFKLLAPRIPVGGQVLSHDAKLRKGRWFVPYVSALDNWSSQLHDISEEGLFHARKIRDEPSPASAAAAERSLARLRSNLIERTGAMLPSRVNGFLLRLLPARVARRVSQGRR